MGLHGQDVVTAGPGHQGRRVVLDMQSVHRDEYTVQVEELKQLPGGGDLVALFTHGDLAVYHAGSVSEGGDQVRRRGAMAACAPDRLPVDRDHPATCDKRGPGQGPGAQHRVETVRVETGEQAPQSGFVHLAPLKPQPFRRGTSGVLGPLPNEGR